MRMIIILCLFAFSCTPASVNMDSSWKMTQVNDKFGEPAGEMLVAEISGSFSNSATVNSTLLAVASSVDTNIYIRLYEYGRNPVSISDFVDVNLETRDTFYNVLFSKNRLFTTNKDLHDKLASEVSPVKIYCEIQGSEYRFDIPPLPKS